MSTELVPVDGGIVEADDRKRALADLVVAAETTDDETEARQIMVKAKLAAEMLTQIKAPFEETRLAGKASVVAARRLAQMLKKIPSKPRRLVGVGNQKGWTNSERGELAASLGIPHGMIYQLLRLTEIDDPIFQRYIQRTDIIPSVHGALRNGGAPKLRDLGGGHNSWRTKRRREAGVTNPKSPSLDEAHSLIVRALGHLTSQAVIVNTHKRSIGQAIDHLYAAEDLIKPYLGGYVK